METDADLPARVALSPRPATGRKAGTSKAKDAAKHEAAHQDEDNNRANDRNTGHECGDSRREAGLNDGEDGMNQDQGIVWSRSVCLRLGAAHMV